MNLGPLATNPDSLPLELGLRGKTFLTFHAHLITSVSYIGKVSVSDNMQLYTFISSAPSSMYECMVSFILT